MVSRLAAPRMTEHYSLVRCVVQDCRLFSLAAGGQDVGDMRVEGRTLGASGLKSHPAGKPWNPRTGVAAGPAAGQAWRRAASTIGGDGQTAHLFSPGSDHLPSMQRAHYKNRAGSAGRNSRNTLSTQTWDRMSGTLIAAGQPRVGYLPILLDASRHRGKNSLISAVRLLVHRQAAVRGCHRAPEIR